MVLQNKIKQIPRTKDQTYLYTLNPSPIHPNSNKISHHLKITDYFITLKHKSAFLIEPTFGQYQPDIYFIDNNKVTVCVEIQLTKISIKKMQQKVNQFVSEYGNEHDSKIMLICSNTEYKGLLFPKGFQVLNYPLPPEINL